MVLAREVNLERGRCARGTLHLFVCLFAFFILKLLAQTL